jgi:hypothetical protein
MVRDRRLSMLVHGYRRWYVMGLRRRWCMVGAGWDWYAVGIVGGWGLLLSSFECGLR